MRRALIREGDPTTTGGVVVTASADGMTDEDGKTFALFGDEATCGKCKGTFRIRGTATRRCYDGRAGVVAGDLVLCPCGQNRVMASPNAGCFYEDCEDTGDISRVENVVPSSAAVYDEQILLIDRMTGQPLTDFPYRFRNENGTLEGLIGRDGHTIRVHTDKALDLDFEHTVGEGDGWE